MNQHVHNLKSWKVILLFVLLGVANVQVRAQALSSYCFAPLSGTFTPLTGATALPTLLADDIINGAAVPIGFSFNLAGTAYTHIWPSSNVWFTLGTSSGMAAPTNNYNFAFTAAPGYPIIMPLSHDGFGYTGGTASASYVTTGTSPNRVFTIEWLNWNSCCTSVPAYSVQCNLYEATGAVEFVYRQDANPATLNTPRIGIALSNSNFIALNNSNANPALLVNTDVTTPNGIRPATGQIYRFVPPGPVVYDSSYALQNTAAVAQGATNAQVLSMVVKGSGCGFGPSITQLSFNTIGTTNLSDISNARVYYTGTSNAFSTASQYGSTVSTPGASFNVNGTQALAGGDNYFWLTFDVSNTATINNNIDAEFVGVTVGGTPFTPGSTSPAGARQVKAPLSGTYTVGASGQFTTLTQAANDISSLGVNGPVTFQLIDPVYSSATGEIFPITISSYPGMSATNNITIRPAPSINPLIVGNNATSIFIINGVRNLSIDGRPTPLDITRELTIENQNTTANATVIRYINDAVGNRLRNTIIRSANTNTNTATQPVFGAVYIGGTNLGLAVGNDSIRIENNYFARSNNLPYTKAIVSDGQSAIFQNDAILIDSNDFNGFTQNAIFVTNLASGNGSNWRIRNNNFYDTATTTSTNAIICIDFNPSTNSNSNNNIISGNVIGGNLPQAPTTAGNRWLITSSIAFTGIRASGGSITGTTVTNNIIRSIRIMNTANTNLHTGITAVNPGVAIVTNNTIGDLADTNSIFTNTNGAFVGISGFTTNDLTVSNNIISNINVAGNLASTAVRGINIGTASSNTLNLNNNIIRAMRTRSTNTGSTTAAAWNGIVVTSSSPNQFITNNTIGGSDPSDSCAIYYGAVGTELIAGTPGGSRMVGIVVSGGANTVNNNTIKQLYSMSNGANTGNNTPNILGIGMLTGTNNNFAQNNMLDSFLLHQPTVGHSINGIVMTSGTVLVSGNTIRNFRARSTSTTTSTGASINGINWSSANPQTVINNTISDFDNSASAAHQMNGIVYISSAGSVVRGNTIRNLRSNTTSATGIVGVNNQSSALNQTVSNNTIHSLVSYATAATAPGLFGIIYLGSATIVGNTNNTINGNFIHSFTVDNLATGSATLTAIQIASGNSNVVNNVIRIGRDSSGTPISRLATVRGVHLNTSGAIQNRFYNNTIYVESAPLAGVGQTITLDFAGNATGVGFNDIRNNILVNRTANSGGTGQHFVIRNNGTNLLGYTINNNIYDINTSGTNFLGRVNAINHATLPAWQAAVLRDGSSGAATLGFNNATGDFQSVNMRLATTNRAERGGDPAVLAFVTTDFTGAGRDTLTPMDLGAYAGRDTILADINAPIINYTALTNTASPGFRSFTATVIDGGGLPVQANKLPRVYYKKNFGGSWADSTGTLVSGDRFNGTWSFTMNPANIGGLTSGDSVYYYVIAEDSLSINVNTNPMYATATGVGSVATPPSLPNIYRITDPLPLTVNVGAGQAYTTLTGVGGLFEAINNGIIGGNTEALITSDILEPLTVALNRWQEAGAGGYTLTIRPDTNTQRIISTVTANANGIIQLNNVNGFKMLGWSPSGSTSDTNLVIRASSLTTPAISFINGGVNDTFVNVIFESRISNAGSGIMFIQNTALPATNGVSNMLVQSCHFRQDLTSVSASLPVNGIFLSGTSPRLNTNFRITGCHFYNITGNSINVLNGSSGNNFTITNNHFYFNAVPTGLTTAWQGITFTPGLTSENNVISGNWLGGTAPFTGGTNLITNNQIVPISVSSGSGAGSLVNNNVISNIRVTGASGMTGIFLQGTAAIYTVNGNRIGNFNDSATSIIFTASSNQRLQGINSNASGNVTITNDTVVNIFNYGTGATAGVTGILVGSGSANITNVNNNLIANLILTASTNTSSTTAAALMGITVTSSSNNQFIQNNTIRNLRILSTANHQLTGIQVTGGVNQITNNRVSNLFTASNRTNDVTFWGPFGAANALSGIINAGFNGGIHFTTGNTVDSLVASTAANTQVVGIHSTYNSTTTQYMVENNTVQNIISNSTRTNIGQDAAVIGIMNFTSAPNQITDRNIIRNLRLTSNSAGSIYGIFYQGSASFNGNVASVSRNLIHSLSSNAQSPIVPSMVGIFNNTGIATYANNMIRLGIDSAGVADTSARILSGIRQSTSNASANRYYNNSILIAGEPQSGNANSAAIEIVPSIPVVGGFVNVVDIRNNILANNRNNTVNAIGRNWGLKLANTTNIISNYNLYHITGTGGIVGGTTVDYYTLNNFDTSWQAATRLDLASGSGNPNFVTAATGAFNGVLLNVQANTPIERSGDATVVLTQDYYGNSRSSLTPTDIGSHAGNFNQTPDVFPPVITFTPLANSGTLSGVRTFADVTITDNNGIPTSGASAPKVYYSKDNTTWFSVGATSFTGTSTNATFTFGIDYTPLGSLTVNDTIRYFVIAQDLNGNIISNSPYAVASNVNTIATFPTNANFFRFLPTIPANTIFYVGATSTYTSLTNTGGFFEFLNNRTTGGNIFVHVTSNLLNETGTVSLNPISQDGPGAGNFAVTIRPDSGTTSTYLIEGSASNGLINFTGSNHIKFTGVPAGGSPTVRRLQVRNNNLTASTISMLNGATGVSLSNLIIEGGNNSTTAGVVSLRVTSGTAACSQDTVTGCIIRNNPTVGLPNGIPSFGIYSDGTPGILNSANVFTNNEISNYINSGIAVANNNGNGYVITGNSMFNNIGVTLVAATQFVGINFFTNNNSSGNTISGNFIGGSSANCGGTPWTSTSFTTAFIGVRAAVGTGATTTVSNNTIANINFTSPGSSQFNAIISDNGNIAITNNTVGSTTNNSSIVFANATTHSGITYQGVNNCVINNNTVAGLVIGTPGLTASLNCVQATNGAVSSISGNTIGSALVNSIQLLGTGVVQGINASVPLNYIANYDVANNTVRNIHIANTQSTMVLRGIFLSNTANPNCFGNSVNNLTSNSTNIGNTTTNMVVQGIVASMSSTATIATIRNNTIFALRALNTSGGATPHVSGIVLSTGQGHIVNANRIYDLTNASTSTSLLPTPSVAGINISSGQTNSFITNNQITLGTGTAANTQLIGIWLNFSTTGYTLNAINNSVVITGTSSGNQNSYAFLRGNNSATEINTFMNLRNNIFLNNRAGGTGAHFAIANQTPSPTNTTWNLNSSQFNLFATANTGTVAQWGVASNNIVDWRNNSGSDNFTYYAQTGTGAAQINPSNLFTNIANGELNLQTANAEVWYVYGKGITGSQINNLNTDYAGNARSTTQGFATTIGSMHMTSAPSMLPIAATASAAPAANTITSYTFASRPVASIVWGASAPTAATVYDFTGVNPPAAPAGNVNNRYVRTDISGGTAPYNYGLTYNFNAANLGNTSNGNNIRLATSNVVVPTSWTTQFTTSSNASTGIASVSGLSATGSAITFTGTELTAPPTITAVTPAAASVGIAVTIRGTLFTGASAVSFNGTPQGTYTVVNDTTITTTVPAGATTGPISVTNPFGTGTSAFNFVVIPAPTITSFTPTDGTFGTAVSITGTGFTWATGVRFNGLAASFTVVNNTTITTTVPTGATTGNIRVTNGVDSIESSSPFTVFGAPTVASFTPGSGPVGTSVAITGTNFNAITAVRFNGINASYTVNSATSITALVPPSATTGAISVVNGSGTGTSGTNFTVTTPPTVTTFTPSSGGVGTTIVISGTNFTGATAVLINTTPAASFTVNSASQITAVVASGTTSGRVRVITPSGTDSSATNFTLIADLIVSTNTTVSGTYNNITVTGTGVATLSGTLNALGNTTIQTGGTIIFGTEILSGLGTFTAQSGSRLVIGSPQGIDAVGISGNIQVNGARTINSGARVEFNAAIGNQNTGNLISNIDTVVVNVASGDLILNNSLTVNNRLDLTLGSVRLGANNLTIGSSGSVANANSTNYVKTNGIGTLRRTVQNNSTNVPYPVGSATSYTPAQVQLNGTSTTDVISVRVFDGVLSAATSGTPIASSMVNRTWIVSENVVGGSNATITLQWNGTDEVGSFNRALSAVSRFNTPTNQWTYVGTTFGAAAGTDPYTRSIAGVTSLTAFTVGDSFATSLPVNLIAFTAKALNNDVLLSWSTASEQNNKGFAIERSTDGENFVEIDFVDGKDFSLVRVDYKSLDQNAFDAGNTLYYRLRQVDFDGTTSYSDVVSVTRSNVPAATLNVYPNPFTQGLTLEIVSLQDEAYNVIVTDLQGRTVATRNVSAVKGLNTISMNEMDELKAGIYFVKLIGEESITLKVVKAN